MGFANNNGAVSNVVACRGPGHPPYPAMHVISIGTQQCIVDAETAEWADGVDMIGVLAAGTRAGLAAVNWQGMDGPGHGGDGGGGGLWGRGNDRWGSALHGRSGWTVGGRRRHVAIYPYMRCTRCMQCAARGGLPTWPCPVW